MERNGYKYLYKRVRWLRLAAIVKREQPICYVCKNAAVKEVDHIQRVEIYCRGLTGKAFEAKFHDRRNLAGICSACHFQKSGEENTLSSKHGPLFDADGNPLPALEEYAAGRRRAMLLDKR